MIFFAARSSSTQDHVGSWFELGLFPLKMDDLKKKKSSGYNSDDYNKYLSDMKTSPMAITKFKTSIKQGWVHQL